MSALSVQGVRKAFGELQVLQDVSLEFAEGEVTAIVGRSGCGKSTLLKSLNGLVRPDAGAVTAFGHALNYDDLPLLRRRMGYAVQGTGLFPHLSARDNIVLSAVIAGWEDSFIEQRLNRLLDLTHLLPEQLPKFPHQLSGGQQQRVGLCRAMMLEPEVLLLDEPFAAIDPITRFDIHRQLLEVLAAEPATVVLVTHDMREAMLLADRVVVMDAGQVVLSESVDALRASRPGVEPEALLQELMQEMTQEPAV